jgi:hypothetical protein
MEREGDLFKIVVELGYHWSGIGGEGIWARPVGAELYEVDNIPFYAYGLNVGDVVRAVAPSPDVKPVVQSVYRASGHRTLRVHFAASTAEPERVLMLRGLSRFQTSFEGQNAVYFAIDVAPMGEYEQVIQQLQAWEDQGLLAFETCECRVAGGFGADPAEDEPSGRNAG